MEILGETAISHHLTNRTENMILGVLLPHTKLYGGVKRFLELGNIFVGKGHRFIVFTPDGKGPSWFDYKGETATFDSIKDMELDALWTTTVKFMPVILSSKARHKIFYHVRKSDNVSRLMKNPEVEVFACSTNVYDYDLKKYGRMAFKAIGGVTVANYRPKHDYEVRERPFVVMAYGHIVERVKGTHYVVSACEKLYAKGYNIKLLLFDTPVDDGAAERIRKFTCKCPFEFVVSHPFNRNWELFHRADCFVSAENPRYSGWNNTVAEAMACAVPVITTKAGTLDLIRDKVNGIRSARWRFCFARHIKKLYGNETLRRKYGTAGRRDIMEFDWSVVAEKIITYLNSDDE